MSVTVWQENEVWVAQVPALDLIGLGATRDEALADLRETFALAWRAYALESDDNLTPDARALKVRLLEHGPELRA